MEQAEVFVGLFVERIVVEIAAFEESFRLESRVGSSVRVPAS